MPAEQRTRNVKRHGALTFRQYRAISLLLQGHTDKAIGQILGIRPETMCKWWRKSEFRKVYEKHAQQILYSAMAEAKKALKEAIATLRAELRSEKAADRIRAAGMLIQSAFKAQEVTEIIGALIEMKEFKAELEAAKRSGGFFHDAGAGEADAGASEMEPGGTPAVNGHSHQ